MLKRDIGYFAKYSIVCEIFDVLQKSYNIISLKSI